jgi:glyoxylase-like metal-dependent hydrolase (beta-lactamase superfamily II)
MHGDHIGGFLPGDAATFPNATVHVNEADLAFWTDEAIAAQAPAEFQGMFTLARAVAAAYGERLQPFSGETEVAPGVTSLPLPGHTVGHNGFRLASGDHQVIVFGDAVNSAAVQFAHPGAGLIFDTDPALAAETRARFFDMLATDRTLVAGTHMPFPGLGHVARSGGAYAWVPEEWHYG